MRGGVDVAGANAFGEVEGWKGSRVDGVWWGILVGVRHVGISSPTEISRLLDSEGLSTVPASSYLLGRLS